MKTPDSSLAELVADAQLDGQGSMSKLAELAGERLIPYLYRMTLDSELAEDLLQETLLQMVKSLKDLRKPESFWPWMYRVAMGKAQHHFRTQARRGRVIELSSFDNEIAAGQNSGYEDGLTHASRKELGKVIFEAISQLRFKYRNVLVLRCFEQRPYSEIASIMDCSRTNAQVLFFRAKQSLKKQLARQGISKALMLPGLALFGKLTAPSKAAIASVSITASSTKVSLLAALVGGASTRIGISILTIILAALTTTGIISVKNSDRNGSAWPVLPGRAAIKSFHFVKQSWSNAGQPGSNLLRGRSLSKGAYEQWFYFPEGIDGPMFMMMQRWDPKMTSKLCSWMQNRSGNYYYYSGNQTIYVRDYHLPLRDLRTRRLPSDTPEFTAFLDETEGTVKGAKYTRDEKTGLLTGIFDDRFYNTGDFQSCISYNNFDEESFKSFRYSWPEDATTVDQRDAMHKRGWTYFTIEGHIDGEDISGFGRIPFTYDTYCEYQPWLQIEISNRLKIIDTPGCACIVSAGQEVLAVYPGGSFFKGLTAPWMGMHTIDLIRRDAAEERIGFDTKKTDSDTVLVRLLGQTEISYKVNLYKDLVEEIGFVIQYDGGYQSEGVLRFGFLDEVAGLEEQFVQPGALEIPKESETRPASITWLFKLAQAELAE